MLLFRMTAIFCVTKISFITTKIYHRIIYVPLCQSIQMRSNANIIHTLCVYLSLCPIFFIFPSFEFQHKITIILSVERQWKRNQKETKVWQRFWSSKNERLTVVYSNGAFHLSISNRQRLNNIYCAMPFISTPLSQSGW